MADTNLGTARGKIVVDYDPRGAKAAKSDVESIDKSAQRSSKGLNTFAKGTAIVGAALVGAFALAVKTSADFEKQISAVGAVSGATDQELQKIRETALRIGKDTKFSASEAAVAMEELAKAGVSTEDILNGAADATVALAAAGGVELPQAATIASNAMNAFSLSAKDLPHVADLIAGAANASAIDVGEFGQSLQQAGAVAHTVGVPFDDLAVAIAELGNAGIKGSDAGTSLKTMLQNLNPQTAKQRDLMKELGIVTEDGANKFFDAHGNIKSLADVSQVLQDSLKGQTKQQKLATLETLFGSDAIRAAAILAENGAAGFDKLAANMGKVSAADVAAKRMDNLAGSIEQFKGSVETALIVAGAPFQSGLRSIVDLATRMVNAFANLAPSTQKLIGQFLAFGGVALLVSAGALKIALVITRLNRELPFLAKAFGLVAKAIKAASLATFANPIGIAIIAIIALVAALVLLFNKNKAFHDFVIRAWEGIKAAFASAVAFFVGTVLPALSTGWSAVTAAVGATVAFIRNAWQSLQPVIQPVIAFIVNTIRNGMQVIRGIIQVVMGLITGNWTQVWTGIKNIASGLLNQLLNVIRTIINIITGSWTAFGSRLVSAALSFIGRILAAVASFAAALPGRILFAIGFIIGRWIRFQADMIRFAIRMGSQVLAAVVSFFSKLPGRIASFLASAFVRMVSWASNMISRARTAGSQVLSAISSFFSQLPGRVASFLSSALSRMRTFASQLPSLARQAASGVVSAISSGLSALPGIVSGAVGRAISAFQGMVGRAFAAAKSVASSLWSGFKAGLGISSPSFIERAMTDLNDAMERELGLFEKHEANVVKVAESLARDTTSALSGLGSASANVTGNVSVSGRSPAANELQDQTKALTRLAAAVPRGETALRVVAATPPTTPSNVLEVNFNISGVQDAAGVRQVVTSPQVLRPLAQAARARGGGGSF